MTRTKPAPPELPWSDRPVWPAVSTGHGWWPLIAELDRKLSAGWPGYRVDQVKSKFGTLHFYATFPGGYDSDGQELINEYEQKSATICEDCGRPGTPGTEGAWVSTRCDACAADVTSRRPGVLTG